MNVPLGCVTPRWTSVQGAKERGMVQLEGHCAVGGMRASIYNAMPIEACRRWSATSRNSSASMARAGVNRRSR